MPFQIPFARTIEELIASFPTNSQQAIKLRELGEKITVLEKENKELKKQLAVLLPKHGMDVDTGKVLKVFFDQAEEMSAADVASILGIQKRVVDFHIDKLRQLKFMMQSRAITNHSPGLFSIYPAGRAFVVENKLA